MNKKVFTLALAILSFFSVNSQAANVVIDINGGDVSIMGTVMNVPDYGEWYYFSFETGTVVGTSDFELIDVTGGNVGTEVPNAEWAARTDWDIAFHATDIRTNNAKAVLIAGSESSTPLADVYAALTVAPTEGYEADELISGTFMQSMSTMPPPRATQMSACKATNGWATFGMSASATNPVVVVFELADGKHVKVYLKEFFDADGKPGYIDMDYAEIPAAGTSAINTNFDVNFSIYPNPTTEILHVELTESASVDIYSMTGVAVRKIQAKVGVNSISVNDLPAGTYFVKANNRVRKLIVK